MNNIKTVKLPKRGFICESCGEVGFPVTKFKGSFAVEALLWLMFLLPGLIYTTWRRSTSQKSCPECSGRMVPIRSPGGRHLAQKFNPHVVVRG